MIPDGAVEAALETSLRQLGLWGKDLPAGLLEARRNGVRELLEAAAPHLMAEAWQRGYLYSYYQERGYVDDGTAAMPEHLTEDVIEWNPHKTATK